MRIKKHVERWFSIPDDPDQSEILIRHLSQNVIDQIINGMIKQETHYKKDEKTGNLIPDIVSHTDADAMTKSIFCEAVRDWKNIFDVDGSVLKCTDENKKKAFVMIDGFSEFVDQCREMLKTEIEEEKEKLEKN